MTPTIRQVMDAKQSEAEFQRAVTDLLALRGWRYTHFRSTQERSGRWATALSGHKGWPDIAAVRDGRLCLIELKSQRGVISPDQRIWLDMLYAVETTETHLFRPSDWDTIQRELS